MALFWIFLLSPTIRSERPWFLLCRLSNQIAKARIISLGGSDHSERSGERLRCRDHARLWPQSCMQLDEKSVNDLKDVSFHHIDNAFDKIYFRWGHKFGIYGSTPPETLHMFYLGICEYLYDGFYCKLNVKIRKLLDIVSKEMVSKSQGRDMVTYLQSRHSTMALRSEGSWLLEKRSFHEYFSFTYAYRTQNS